MKTYIYPGTFDPFTLGHLDIATRASKMCDKLIVAVSTDRLGCMFTADKRAKLVRASIKDIKNCEAVTFSGLLPVFAKSINAACIVRGTRSAVDFLYESNLLANYKLMAPEIENIILLTDIKYSYISSSIVRDLIKYDADIKNYVPEETLSFIKEYK